MVNVSDEFFAEAYQLLLVEVRTALRYDALIQYRSLQPPVSLAKQYGPNGELYSGWETRRHNPTYDWWVLLCYQCILQEDILHRCTIKLGTTGIITGFDIDTTHFSGVPWLSLDIRPEFDSVAA